MTNSVQERRRRAARLATYAPTLRQRRAARGGVEQVPQIPAVPSRS